MNAHLPGIHHVTAIASDPQRNLNFYAGLLGLRLVKVTVNFDDPGTYHFYYGDETGTPGTILTFFPWPGARHGRRGTGQSAAVAFTIPDAALGYWVDRLSRAGLTPGDPQPRFAEQALTFFDPDGLALELVTQAGAGELPGWEQGPVPAQHAIRGVHSVTLWESDLQPTAALLTGTLGLTQLGEEQGRIRFQAGGPGIGTALDLVPRPGELRGQGGAGTIHHVAWRAPGSEEQQDWRQTLLTLGLNVTPVLDRQYFRSIYFREPGGVLFEIATDAPGFALDEPISALGSSLKLPPWLEGQRAAIEDKLPPIQRPAPEEQRHV